MHKACTDREGKEAELKKELVGEGTDRHRSKGEESKKYKSQGAEYQDFSV